MFDYQFDIVQNLLIHNMFIKPLVMETVTLEK